MIRRTEFGSLTNEDAEVVVGRVMDPSSLVVVVGRVMAPSSLVVVGGRVMDPSSLVVLGMVVRVVAVVVMVV